MVTLLAHSAASVAALLLAMSMFTAANAETILKNGDVFEKIQYADPITYDANAKLKDETAYSSTIVWKDCTVSNTVTVNGTFDFDKPFPTSLYFKVEKATFTVVGLFDFFNMPPNLYIHALGSVTPAAVSRPTYFVTLKTQTDNITLFIDDSTIIHDGETDARFVDLVVPDSSPYIVVHIRNLHLTSSYGIFQTTTCNDGSTLFLEKVTCVKPFWDLVGFHTPTISRQSALIMKDVKLIGHTNPTYALLYLQSVTTVDATSVLAMIDIDLTENFQSAAPPQLFHTNGFLTGDGTIVFLRIKIGPSGLIEMQPGINKNFWIAAMQISSREMTTAELRASFFNVNEENVIHWDGTGDDGKCVQAGLALPGTATYELMDGQCEATCPQGNYLPPACTPSAVCTGVPNCQACYAHPKNRCLQCLPHTEQLNDDTLCKCRISECIECPEATLCTKCIADYKFSAEHNSCFHCTIDKCAVCKSDGQCSTCEDGYKLYNNQCIACGIDNCQFCKEPEKCTECSVDHKPATEKFCFYCTAPGCEECRADGVCGVCKDGYLLIESPNKPTENKCVRCRIDVPKCEVCKTDGVCSQCITDHKPTANGKNCFQCAISFCEECSADGVCASCKDGYSLHDNECVRCAIDVPKCKLCETDGVCSQCATDHKPTANGKVCFQCAIPFCKECRADGVCAFCDAEYSLTDNKCFHCTIDKCAACNEDGKCATCEDGYKLYNNQCIACTVDKCNFCNEPNKCSECIPDHKPANGGASCNHCIIPFCKECGADGVCGQCDDGYSLANNNRCVRCTIDVPNCGKCETDGICSECAAGHTLSTDGLRCTMCTVDDCQRCDIAEVCALCSPGMTTNGDGQCTACDIGNCTYCSASNKCALCTCGLIPSDDGESCVHCSAGNCKHCDPASGGKKCAECQNGYEVSSAGACIKSGLPQWVVFLIVVAVSILLMAAVVVGYNLFLRRRRRFAQMAADAEERRRNRMCSGRGARHYTEIAVLDLGDIEDAASGVRDTIKTNRV